jgi:adenine-specific DNA-methyltransferase
MKYMGSKRTMLASALGELLRSESQGIKRFADLFVGSAAVAWYVAENFRCHVIAADLQVFAVTLANAVIGRNVAISPELVWQDWSRDADARVRKDPLFLGAEQFEKLSWKRARRRNVDDARHMCLASEGPITRAYGGHYFSPKQALLVDALRTNLPVDPAQRSVALAALICAASECVAAPGHTAQPFQPTKEAAPFLFEAWRRDVLSHAKSALERICPKHAQISGKGTVCDAEALAGKLCHNDVAFIDPPYSGVHYSRFYHVLETIAQGSCSVVTGVGRYPDPSERPKSDFSIRSKSKEALKRLFSKLAENGVRTIVTFPAEETSNGLSGSTVETVAGEYFSMSKTVVNGRFSTLGGNLRNRKARVPAYEIILALHPRD